MKILFISLIIIIIFIFVGLLVCVHKYKKTLKELNSLKREGFRNNNKYIMIEYYVRNYKEGDNIFTAMRNIQNTIYNDEIKNTYN